MPENLATALAAFQRDLPKIAKANTAQVKSDKGNYSYKYADLAEISLIVLPLLGKHGLSFTSAPTLDEGGRFVLRYTLRHAGGDAETGSYPLPSSGRPQEIGSAITYARRYALCAVTGVAADEDDDGAQAPPSSRQPADRHESSWDPEQQEALREKYQAKIAAATSEEIAEIGKELLDEKRAGRLSPNTYQHLAIVGGRRRGELDTIAQSNADFAAAQAAGHEPATVPPATDTPSRRDRQLAAFDRAVDKKKAAADGPA